MQERNNDRMNSSCFSAPPQTLLLCALRDRVMMKTDAERIFHSGTTFSSNFKKGEDCKGAEYLWIDFLKDNWLSDFFILLTK